MKQEKLIEKKFFIQNMQSIHQKKLLNILKFNLRLNDNNLKYMLVKTLRLRFNFFLKIVFI